MAAGPTPPTDSSEPDSTHFSAGSASRETRGDVAETRWPSDLHAARLREHLNARLPPRPVAAPRAAIAAPVQPAPLPWQACPVHQTDFSVGDHVSLIMAIRCQDFPRAVRFIHEMPFRLDDRDASGRSALHYAVEGGVEPLVAGLLTGTDGVAADPNVRTFFGITPLHVAAARGQPGLLSLLIHHGADVNAKTVFNASVLDIAGYWRRPYAIGALSAVGAQNSGVPWAMPAKEKGLLREWISRHGVEVAAYMLAVTPAEAMRLAGG